MQSKARSHYPATRTNTGRQLKLLACAKTKIGMCCARTRSAFILARDALPPHKTPPIKFDALALTSFSS